MGTVRLLQLVAFAAFCLFLLKTAGLIFSGGYVFSGAAPANAQSTEQAEQSAASKIEKQPDKAASVPDQQEAETAGEEVSGKTDEAGPQADSGKASGDQKPEVVEARPGRGATETELALLQSLSARRQKLEKQQRELELRENLLKAAEKRVSGRIAELKSIENRIEKELKKQDDERTQQHMRLVKMYATMKPKSAATIFNRLDLDILMEMVKKMRPQAMSKILAAMEPAAARRLTTELAKSDDLRNSGAQKLPKIGANGSAG